jgi:hypothetical protein
MRARRSSHNDDATGAASRSAMARRPSASSVDTTQNIVFVDRSTLPVDLLITPHVAWTSDTSMRRLAESVIAAIEMFVLHARSLSDLG